MDKFWGGGMYIEVFLSGELYDFMSSIPIDLLLDNITFGTVSDYTVTVSSSIYWRGKDLYDYGYRLRPYYGVMRCESGKASTPYIVKSGDKLDSPYTLTGVYDGDVDGKHYTEQDSGKVYYI